MTSGTIEDWRVDPRRWSTRFSKTRRKDFQLRRTKSVDADKNEIENTSKIGNNPFDVIEEAPSDYRDDGFVESDSIPDEPIEEKKCCVLCVGSTGTGKSFTISTMTGLPVASNDGAESVTKRCALYRPMTKLKGQTPEEISWIDTVGWDDSDMDDEETFKDILRFVSNNNLTSIKAILWHVLPNVRRDALLTRQARLIDQFVDGNKIWENVIIVCKQAMNPEDDSRGPITVAMEYNANADVQVVGYRSFEDPTITDKQRKAFENDDIRAAFNVVKKEEIRRILCEKLENIKKPFQVVFHDSFCVDCAEIGDVRLMSTYCHMSSHMTHSGRLRFIHPKTCEFYHPNMATVYVHDGYLRKNNLYVAVDFFTRKSQDKGKRYTCCNQRNGEPGCVRKWACCKEPYQDDASSKITGCQRRYGCCKADYATNPQGCEQRYSCCDRTADEEGCQKMCKKCDRPWGSEPRGCYKKPHNVRRLSLYGKEAEELLRSGAKGDDRLKFCRNDIDEDNGDSTSSKRSSKLFHKAEMPPVIIYHIF